MSSDFYVRIYELLNRPHSTIFDELWEGGYGYSFHDVSPAMEIVFETESDWTIFRVTLSSFCTDSEFGAELMPSLTTSISRELVDALINQLSMSKTAIVVERMKLGFRNGHDHDRLQAALDAAVAPEWAVRSFSI